jgi:hypothetical protein
MQKRYASSLRKKHAKKILALRGFGLVSAEPTITVRRKSIRTKNHNGKTPDSSGILPLEGK